MDFVQILISNFDGKVLKEPRGFMKILQFFFTICAFATTTSFMSTLKISIMCDQSGSEKKDTANIQLFYNFQLDQQSTAVCSDKSLDFLQSFASDSSFFVAVGVLGFLFSIGALVFYLIFDKIYLEDPRVPNLDFGLHCMFTVLFLAGSSAWANSLSGLKHATSLQTIVDENPDVCSGNNCQIEQAPDFTKLNISIILGFLDVFLFASNLWFIYKETSFFAGTPDPQKTATEAAPQTIEPRV